jgi:site-specific recombinase XerD
MRTESVHLHGQAAKDRRVRFGPKTSRALSRYLRAYGKRRCADEIPQLWMAERGRQALTRAASSSRSNAAVSVRASGMSTRTGGRTTLPRNGTAPAVTPR